MLGGLWRRRILVGICGLVLQDFDELVEPRRHDRSQKGSQPVDPVVADEMVIHHGRPERSRGVEAAAGEVDACELGDEEGEADS